MNQPFTASGLPPQTPSAQAAATVDHSVLTLRLPKAETAKPKQIKVTAK